MRGLFFFARCPMHHPRFALSPIQVDTRTCLRTRNAHGVTQNVTHRTTPPNEMNDPTCLPS